MVDKLDNSNDNKMKIKDTVNKIDSERKNYNKHFKEFEKLCRN